MTLKISTSSKDFQFFNIIAFDSESYRYDKGDYELQQFFNMDFYDGKKHYYSENLNDVVPIILMFKKKYKKITLFAHNIKYDIRILHLLDYLASNKFLNMRSVLKMLDSNIFVKFSSPNNEYVIQFSDSMNYFKTSLSRLAKMFGYSKVDEEEYNLSPEEWNNQLKISGKDRVQTDTEILYTALQSFSNMNFNFGMTLAGTSLNTFKNQYLKKPIYFPDALINPALQSYHGGIVLPYRLGEIDNAYSYDVNSLYPYVMKENYYSINFKDELTNFKYIYDDIKNNNYNYLVNVDYLGNDYSPVFTYYDNSLIPFLSNDNQWMTGKELLALYENNFSIKINKVYEFHNAQIFREFVTDYYNKRLNSKSEYEREFYKILLNSLYGKMGQHRKHSEFIKIEDIKNPMIKEILNSDEDKQFFYINEQVYSKYGKYVTVSKEGIVKYNPLIASEVTANARLVNFDYTKMFGFDNVIYTDTDSFTTTVKKSLLLGEELGKLKIEKEGTFTIYAPKDYEFYGYCNKRNKGCKICNEHKGIHYTLKGVRNPELLYGNNYINYKWSGLKYSKNEDVYIEKIAQSLNRVNKKMFYKDGIGYEWLNKKEYSKHTAKNIKSPQFEILNDIKVTL